MERSIRIWLVSVMALIAAIIVVGGITRLTGSGLSMVDWRPIFGILPPITDSQWLDVFTAYKNSPEYLKVNQGMNLSQFKFIFFWEYLHRIMGRLIGLSALIPFIYFSIKGRLNSDFKKNWLLVIGLIICQGFMGWYMVKSGLVDRPSVSHFRLASHLVLALIIFSLVLWQYLKERYNGIKITNKLKKPLLFIVCFSWLQIIFGAFTAGLDGGKYYNTYPKMGSEWLPESAFMFDGGIIGNIINNPIMIQWIHRWLAVLLIVGCVYLARECMDSNRPSLQYSGLLLVAVLFFQFILGISTLLSNVWIPVAVLHQFGGLLLVSSLVLLLYFANYSIDPPQIKS